MIKGVPIHDWIALAIGVIGLISAYLQSRDRLPSWARRWLANISREKVEEAIEYASRLSGLTPEERRAEAVAYLVRVSKSELGFEVPKSIANLLVEFIYQQWKRRIS